MTLLSSGLILNIYTCKQVNQYNRFTLCLVSSIQGEHGMSHIGNPSQSINRTPGTNLHPITNTAQHVGPPSSTLSVLAQTVFLYTYFVNIF